MLQKIKTRNELKQLSEKIKANNKTIVLTNGAFDLVHAGHVTYLQQAKTLGDVLMIGLNSDSSIKQYKSDKRPLINQDHRALLLAAFECIDYITIFDETTPIELIKVIQPHIHVKGGDYKIKSLPEYSTVTTYGGIVKTLPFIEGCSTSKIIEKIIDIYGKLDTNPIL